MGTISMSHNTVGAVTWFAAPRHGPGSERRDVVVITGNPGRNPGRLPRAHGDAAPDSDGYGWDERAGETFD
jgi:hypothetical protein